MKQRPLSVYVMSVVIVLVLANCVAWWVGGAVKLGMMEVFSWGFLLGMLAMYIAVHMYPLALELARKIRVRPEAVDAKC